MGGYATPEEMSSLNDPYFEQLPPDIVLQADWDIVSNFIDNFPGDMSHLTSDQLKHDVLPEGVGIIKSGLKSGAEETGDMLSHSFQNLLNRIDGIPNVTDSSDGGSWADGYGNGRAAHADPLTAVLDTFDRHEKLYPHMVGASISEHAPDSTTQAGPGAVQLYDQMFTNWDRYLKTQLKEAPAFQDPSASADITDGEPAGRTGLPARPSALDIARSIARGEIKPGDARQQPVFPSRGRHVASGHRDDPIFIHELPTRTAH